MTKEQLERGKKLMMSELFTETMLEGLQLVKGGRKARLKLIVDGDGQYNLDDDALEAVLDTLISTYEEKLEQIKKEFNEL